MNYKSFKVTHLIYTAYKLNTTYGTSARTLKKYLLILFIINHLEN